MWDPKKHDLKLSLNWEAGKAQDFTGNGRVRILAKDGYNAYELTNDSDFLVEFGPASYGGLSMV